MPLNFDNVVRVVPYVQGQPSAGQPDRRRTAQQLRAGRLGRRRASAPR